MLFACSCYSPDEESDSEFDFSRFMQLRSSRAFLRSAVMVASLHARGAMVGISIRWREGAFACEFRAGGSGGTLLMLREDDVIHQEPVASVTAAAERALELSRGFEAPRAKHA